VPEQGIVGIQPDQVDLRARSGRQLTCQCKFVVQGQAWIHWKDPDVEIALGPRPRCRVRTEEDGEAQRWPFRERRPKAFEPSAVEVGERFFHAVRISHSNERGVSRVGYTRLGPRFGARDAMRRHFIASCAIAWASILIGRTAHAADPTTADCLAASEASFKAANQHKLRAERSQLLVCAAASCPADIRKECVSRVDEVNTQIPTLIFAAKDASGADVSAVKVSMDGEVLAERLEGIALSVDPGEHTFTFETAGQSPLSKKLVVLETQKDRREFVMFGAPAVAPLAPVGSARATEAPTSHGLGGQKAWAIVSGGLGIAGLGLGTALGVIALSKKSQAESNCPNLCGTQMGVNEWSSATTFGNVSTIGFVVGGVAIVTGVVLWFTAKPRADHGPSARVGMGPGSFRLEGAW
jgi:hypothetical protein